MQAPDPINNRKTTEFKHVTPPEALPDVAEAQPEITSVRDSRLYINREMSLLAFQWRVLEEARDESNPLLERVKFLAILGSNLDEFFMVRVAGLKAQIETGSVAAGPDGLTPREQVGALSAEVAKLMDTAEECLRGSLMPALEQAGVRIYEYSDLTQQQQSEVDEFFFKKIFPVLTPLAFDPGHPFPHISNLSLNLAVLIRDNSDVERFARLKIPDTLPQLIPVTVPADVGGVGTVGISTTGYIWLDDLVHGNLHELFPGMNVLEAHPFHVTRDAETEIQEWEAGDLLETTERGVRQRRFGDVIRLRVARSMPAHILEILMSNLELEPYDVYLADGHRPLTWLKYVAAIDRHDLKYTPYVPVMPTVLNPEEAEEDPFTAIARRNILLHHPYDSFQPFINFLNIAAKDPHVLAIKMTLYRVGRNSPVVEALLKAVEKGKQVAVLVELKARFDEESNIEWARALEREGVHVVYGLLGLKVHAKAALVVRKEGDVFRRYVHLSTGNYNPVTAHLYTDVGLFTADEDIASDITHLFNFLTGYSAKKDYRKLLLAPINLRERLQTLIRREIEHQRLGKGGHILLKLNSLTDDQVIQLLYDASQEGVKIDLLVRGMCCLRPGVPGISDNIRVVSIVGRFLEHSRIYYFGNGGNPEVYSGSADLMSRNLDRRVEILFPVDDPKLANFLKADLLDTCLTDRVNAWNMEPDGTYVLAKPGDDETALDSQQWFMANSASLKDR